MEKIKQAIEKARQQGGNEIAYVRPNDVLKAAPSEIGEITYRNTRVVALDPRHLERHRIVALNKSDLGSVSFDLLRTQVLQKMEEHGWRTLAIVSPVPECGKTVVAINLAISIAHHTNKTAMLVDFDLRKPKIAEYLGLPSGTSLNEVLERGVDISEALLNPGMPKLVVIPTQRPIPKSAEILTSGKVNSLISDLRSRYQDRIVIFDLPPLLNVDDAISVLPQIDCVLMVVGNGMVTKYEVDESLHLLNASNLLGVILNKAEMQPRNYYD
jgi:protein-tyrosine kinase